MDICDHCGKPIKHPVYLQYEGYKLKYGPKCAQVVKQDIANGMRPITYGKQAHVNDQSGSMASIVDPFGRGV